MLNIYSYNNNKKWTVLCSKNIELLKCSAVVVLLRQCEAIYPHPHWDLFTFWIHIKNPTQTHEMSEKIRRKMIFLLRKCADKAFLSSFVLHSSVIIESLHKCTKSPPTVPPPSLLPKFATSSPCLFQDNPRGLAILSSPLSRNATAAVALLPLNTQVTT